MQDFYHQPYYSHFKPLYDAQPSLHAGLHVAMEETLCLQQPSLILGFLAPKQPLYKKGTLIPTIRF